MASIDWSIYMAGRQDWGEQTRRCIELEKQVADISGLRILPEIMGAGIIERDHTRVVIDVSSCGLSGYEAQSVLEREGIFVEMADLRRMVLITTPSDDPKWYQRLLDTLDTLPWTRRQIRSVQHVYSTSEPIVSVREAMIAQHRCVPLAQSAGCIAGEPFGIYPPGISACMPGEEITKSMVSGLQEAEKCGAKLFGVRAGYVYIKGN